MKVTLVPPQELGDEELLRWRQLRASNPLLISPFFAPEFTLAAAAERAGSLVAVIEDQGSTIGFFPLERLGSQKSRPIGGPLSDYHGVIAEPGAPIDPAAVLKAAGLTSWQFDHLVHTDGPWSEHVELQASSPYVDLSGGYDRYAEQRRAQGSSIITQSASKLRKLKREHKSLRFAFHSDASKLFEKLVRWKRDQYQRTGVVDVFHYPWTISLLRRLLENGQGDLQVVLSALYVDESPIAAHYCLRCRDVMHSWFAAYDTDWQRYSSGNLLLLEMLQYCAQNGVRRFDFGKGPEAYKRRFASDETPLVEGCVELSTLRRSVRTHWRRSKDWIKRTPLGHMASVPGRVLYQLRQRKAFSQP